MRPDPDDPFLMEEWKIEYREHKKKIEDRRQNMHKIYALILRQCSPTIRDQIEALDDWESISNASNPIVLIRTIQQSLYHRATCWKDTHALLEAEVALHKFRQTKRMSNSDYLEKLRELVEVYEHLGGEPGCSDNRINASLIDPSWPTQTRSVMPRMKCEKSTWPSCSCSRATRNAVPTWWQTLRTNTLGTKTYIPAPSALHMICSPTIATHLPPHTYMDKIRAWRSPRQQMTMSTRMLGMTKVDVAPAGGQQDEVVTVAEAMVEGVAAVSAKMNMSI